MSAGAATQKYASRSGDKADVRPVSILSKGFVLGVEGELFVVSRRTLFDIVPLYHFARDDAAGRNVAMVDLVRYHGLFATEVADAFSVHRVTLQKLLKRFEGRGVSGLVPGKGCRMPTKIKDAIARRLLELKKQGVSDREAAERLGISARGIGHALRRLVAKARSTSPAQADEQATLPTEAGAHDHSAEDVAPVSAERTPEEQVGTPPEAPEATADLPRCTTEGVSASTTTTQTTKLSSTDPSPVAVDRRSATTIDSEAAKPEGPKLLTAPQTPIGEVRAPAMPVGTTDTNPMNRSGDRLMAKLGLLDDAVPLFASSKVVPRAGLLLAVPAFIESKVFEIANNVYGSIGPAFYGTRTSVLTFLTMALLRIKRPEALKEVAPPDIGRILGLDRAPEMKTLRGKLHDLAAREKGLDFMRLLAQQRAKEHADDLGYLYVDGHVRVYSGEVKLPKAYVMQRRMAMTGTTDYWVNDKNGQPLLVITAEANEGMTKMLPLVLKEVREVIGDRRATIVFDRGGWSPKLFKSLIDDKWDILTYRKGKTRRVSRHAFKEHKAVIEGHDLSYQLAEKRVRLPGGKLKLRQITMLGDDGYQTNILTNKDGVPPAEVAYFMFNRWRQENYFKYMEDEFALDALVEYGTEEADPNRMVPNPKRKAIDKELKTARLAVAELERMLGAAALKNNEHKRRTVRGFKIANGGAIGKPLREAQEKVRSIEERRKSIPTRVTISEALKDTPVRLRTETKRLSDTFKMIAYQSESALVDLVRPHYKRTERDGRTLIASALQSAAELKVSAGELRVTLAPQSSAHRTRAIAAVCRELNKKGACFPGTTLRLVYEVEGAKV